MTNFYDLTKHIYYYGFLTNYVVVLDGIWVNRLLPSKFILHEANGLPQNMAALSTVDVFKNALGVKRIFT